MKLPKLQLIRSEFKKARTNPLEVQKKVLMQILKENGQTLYGKNHSFSHIRTISEFQENIPLISYETITPYIKKIEQGQQKILTRKKVLFLATTSGTTSKPKHLPVTSERTK
ncbi:MAG: GH3 auxin-responsive promoter family protein, partial [Nanoarchaeota archaeon]|nr:GH3 auxin-responsive promoter family protein [Nanoarchaeota archaeon]